MRTNQFIRKVLFIYCKLANANEKFVQFCVLWCCCDAIGSRTIRTEEAILISLAALDDKLKPEHPPKAFDLAHSIPQSEDTGLKQSADGPFKRKQPQKMKNNQESFERSHDSANESTE